MNPNQKKLIEDYCGRWNTDIAAGWEAGLLGKERIGRNLYKRHPPEHYFEGKNKQRCRDWLLGRDKAMAYRAKMKARKAMHFHGYTESGEVIVVKRKGWNTPRGPIVSRMAEKGCIGDIYVDFTDGGVTKRSVKCGI